MTFNSHLFILALVSLQKGGGGEGQGRERRTGCTGPTQPVAMCVSCSLLLYVIQDIRIFRNLIKTYGKLVAKPGTRTRASEHEPKPQLVISKKSVLVQSHDRFFSSCCNRTSK